MERNYPRSRYEVWDCREKHFWTRSSSLQIAGIKLTILYLFTDKFWYKEHWQYHPNMCNECLGEKLQFYIQSQTHRSRIQIDRWGFNIQSNYLKLNRSTFLCFPFEISLMKSCLFLEKKHTQHDIEYELFVIRNF